MCKTVVATHWPKWNYLIQRKPHPNLQILSSAPSLLSCDTLTQMATSLAKLPFITPSSSSTSKLNNTHQPSNLKLPTNQNVHSQSHHQKSALRRRDVLKGLSLLPIVNVGALPYILPPPSQAKDVVVGSYLPPSPSDPSFVVFKATSKDTPALRAGNVAPYQFIIPPSWKQLRIANILSGNYCQPKCAEPWIEVKFEDEKQGKIQVVASPLIRLTNKLSASIEEIGSPEKLIASLGPFVTGNTYDPDELLEASIQKVGDQTYYKYLLETPYAQTGTHNIAKATSKGNTVILFVASANDKQWQTHQKTLETIVDSFQV